jgi:hypothetical protein
MGTPGSAGGPRKRTGRKANTAPRADPTDYTAASATEPQPKPCKPTTPPQQRLNQQKSKELSKIFDTAQCSGRRAGRADHCRNQCGSTVLEARHGCPELS